MYTVPGNKVMSLRWSVAAVAVLSLLSCTTATDVTGWQDAYRVNGGDDTALSCPYQNDDTATAADETVLNHPGQIFCDATVAPTSPVDLGTAGDFAILTKAGVSIIASGLAQPHIDVTGDVGTSPIASTALTGFSLTAVPQHGLATSAFVQGNLWAANYAVPTPAKLTTAVGDMGTAYVNAAAGRENSYIELFTGILTEKILVQGVYKFGTSVTIGASATTNDAGRPWPSSMTFRPSLVFHGSENDKFIIQIAQDLVVEAYAEIGLTGGAKAENVVFQVGGETDLGVGAHVEGILLCKTKIIFQSGSSLTGAALAQTSVTLDKVTIVKAPEMQSSTPQNN